MIIAFGSQKGGVGKSTSLICVAVELLSRGRSVLAIDGDPQGTLRTWADVAAERGHATPTTVAMGAAMHKPDQLPRLATSYDYVLIDCPPRLGDVQRSALMIADTLVLPCGPSAADAWALAEYLEIVAQARQLRPELRAVGLITRKVKGTAIGRGARDVLAAADLQVLGAELGYRVAYQEAIGDGAGPTTYEPDGTAAIEVKALVDELLALDYPAQTEEVQHA